MKSEEGQTKHSGGRPKKPVKKETVTGLRFSKVEYFLVKRKAEKAGLGITVYIRDMALRGQVISKMSEKDRQIVRHFVDVSNKLRLHRKNTLPFALKTIFYTYLCCFSFLISLIK